MHSHDIYFDNFFTSHQLLKDLAEKSVRATGTIQENWTGGAAKLMTSTKKMKKTERGTFEYRCDGDVFVCKWNDNSIVHVARNRQTHQPVRDAKRRSKGAQTITVKQPHLIHMYNAGMGGVDLMNRLLSSYRPSIRGKKWYWPLFSNFINLTVVAAWRLFCKVNDEEISHLNFRRQITLCLLKQETTVRLRTTGGNLPMLPPEVRLDGSGHFKERFDQGRCAVCKKNAQYHCSKCKVRLHYDKGSDCSTIYHTHPLKK